MLSAWCPGCPPACPPLKTLAHSGFSQSARTTLSGVRLSVVRPRKQGVFIGLVRPCPPGHQALRGSTDIASIAQ